MEADDSAAAATVDPKEATAKEVSDEAFRHVCGWMAAKLAKSHRELGTPTARAPLPDNANSSWTYRLSRGGLTVPTEEFVNTVRGFEVHFDAYHGGKFDVNTQPQVIKRFTQLLVQEYPDLDKAILQRYSTFRLHARVKFLERQRRAARREHLASNRARRKMARDYGRDT